MDLSAVPISLTVSEMVIPTIFGPVKHFR